MLELYHAEPVANSMKVLLCLKEKQIEFVSHYVDLLRFEQHQPGFLAINPNGQVPVLVHDGNIITESTVINEYLEDLFPEVRLRPEDPVERAQMRIWNKFVDEYFCPALSMIGWHTMVRKVAQRLKGPQLQEMLAHIPLKEQRDKWRESAAQAWTEEQLEDWRRRVRSSIERMEQGLRGPWMLGEQFTLADVSLFAMLIRMPEYYADMVNDRDSPRVIEWYGRMMSRPAVKETLAIRPPADAERSRRSVDR